MFVLASPILPVRHQTSIVGASELNCRVRDGNGWTLTAIDTNSSTQASYRSLPGKPESSFTSLCLLSNSNLASQASSWFFILTERFYLSAKIQPDYKFFTLKCQGRFHISFHFVKRNGDPYRIRTDVNGVRGRCLNHLTNGPWCAFTDSNRGPTD